MRSDIIFDQEHARRFVTARQNFLQPILHDFRAKLQVDSAADVGCGVGYFSGFLNELGFNVTAFDGRPENVEEAQRRYPRIAFRHANVENGAIADTGSFDLVLCVGLLYHLENPIGALRNLSRMTGKLLLIESYATPQSEMMLYLRQEADFIDQSLTNLALYASETTLMKLCYVFGFSSVYRFASLPDHEDFRDRSGRKRQRTMFVASRSKLDFPYLAFVPEPEDFSDPWKTRAGRLLDALGGLGRRLGKSLSRSQSTPMRADLSMDRSSERKS